MQMKKAVKVLLWLFGVVVLLLVGLVVVIPMVVDPNDYKTLVVDKVKEATGRDLKIEKELSLSVFPWVGIETGGVELGNAEGFGGKPFARIEHLAVNVKVWPLLSKKVEVGEVELSGLQLNLAKNANGESNWGDLSGEAPPEGAPPQTEETGGGLADLSVGSLVVDSGSFEWVDRSANQSLAVTGFNLTTGAVALGEPVEFSLAFDVDNKSPQAKGNLQLSGRAMVHPAQQHLSLEGTLLKLDLTGQALQGASLKLELAAEVTADGAADVVEIPQLKLDAQLSGGPIAGEPVKLTMTSAVSMQPQAGAAELRDLVLNLAGIQINGGFAATQLNGEAVFNGELQVAPFNARATMTTHGIALPAMADEATLTQLAANLTLKGGMQGTGEKAALHLRVDPLSLKLDDSTLDGHLLVAGNHKGFALTLDKIDLDRYLPPQDSGEAGEDEAPSGQEPAPAGELIPVETLRGLDVAGKFTIGELKVAKLTLRQALVELIAKDGDVQIKQQIGELYQGHFQGQLGVDVRGEEPQLSIQKKLSDVQIGPLLKDMTGDDKLLGKGGFSADLVTSGNSVDEFKKGLNGKADFLFRDGAVNGFNLASIIRTTRAAFSGGGGQTASPGSVVQRTDFSELQGSAAIASGVVTNRDFSAKSPLIRVTGDGQVNLVAERLDYTVTATLVNTLKGQGGEGLDDLVGVPIPVKLTGPWAAPDYKIDWGKVLVGTQKEKLKKKVEEKIMEKIQGSTGSSDAGSAAGELLRGLF
jgi:AsmA protein